jgi:hypothetical protein
MEWKLKNLEQNQRWLRSSATQISLQVSPFESSAAKKFGQASSVHASQRS